MSLENIYGVIGSSLTSQSIRLNAVASNIANANTAASSPEAVFKALKPVFRTVYDEVLTEGGGTAPVAKVEVDSVIRQPSEAIRQYEPEHPLADETGYVYYPSISVIEEMADMLSASRSFQTSMEVMTTAKQLQQRLLALGA
ncbi:flagellar basal body rod protein FlgC [Endozoicomonas arenosclerae]|uniref:flagellar basal body rod protein FlgC n=1 Tax=Endozoicomonas arenosclerae TaxID=1633495 RepID=UPI0007845B8E|nr:flagellar basal body rod protein FlgC [Endozoicomonas arenosclerae]